MRAILKPINLVLILNCYSYQMQSMQQAVLTGQLNQAGMLGSQQAWAQQQMHNAQNQQWAQQMQNYKPPTLKFGNVFSGIGSMGLGIQGLSSVVKASLWSLSVRIKDDIYYLSLTNA